MRLKSLTLLAVTGALTLAVATPAAAAPAVTSTRTAISPVSTTAGKATTITATVSPAVSAGTVAFLNGSATVCAKAVVKSGRATCAMTFGQGSHALTAKYSGASGYAASTGTRTISVAAAQFVGSLGSCTTSRGALVAVNFGHWGGPVVRECGNPAPSTGLALLTAGGFTTAGDRHDGPQFICRIGHPLWQNGTQYPTPAQDPCVVTPPATAYWSYWLAPRGQNSWTYSTKGAYADTPADGEVEAWTFGGTNVAGTTGQPPFTPSQVRAGLPAATARHTPATRRAAAGRSAVVAHPAATAAAAGTSPNLTRGAGYLVDQLTDGKYYDPYGIGYADFGLTMDGVFALAAQGGQDTALAKVVAFLDDRGTDPAGRTVDDYTGIGTKYAAGGSIGKEALAAEVTGHDPRAFGAHDLIAALDKLVCTKAASGKCAGAGNYAYSPSTFAQVLPIIAQLRAGDTKGAAGPVAYLESLQHGSGAFPSVLPGTDSDTDSTGMAAMALALVPGSKARTAVAKALSWLAGQQEKDGGWPGAAGDSTNSAGIVLQALHLDAPTYAKAIAKGERFLAGAQNADGGFDIAANADGSDVRASAQALGGAVGTPFGSVLDALPAKATAAGGANYLVTQLVGGDHYEASFGGTSYPDQGLTADGLFGLLAAGGHASSVSAMTTYLEGQVDAYADPTGAAGGPYSGALAKLSLVADATGNDPHDFGGTDLLKVLKAKTCARATGGEFPACTAKGDFYNAFSTVSQALGVLALDASPTATDRLSATSPAVVRLHELQCKDGGFSSSLIAPGASCTSDVDTTGFAVQALATVPGTETWLAAAQSYLVGAQDSSGLYTGTAGLSSNSTALASDALRSLVDALISTTPSPTAAPTITPIGSWQAALTGLDSLAVSGGGFRISTTTTGADLRSSTQAVLAAAQQNLLQLSGATIRSRPSIGAKIIGIITGGGGSSGGGTSPGGTPSGAGSAPLANTGLDVGLQLAWALALTALGGAVLLGGRRRTSAVPAAGRHRAPDA